MALPRLEVEVGLGVVGAGRWVSKGLFSTVVPCSWLLRHQSLAIESTGLQINSARYLQLVTHARSPAPALAEETTPVNHLHREECSGGKYQGKVKEMEGNRIPSP